MDLDNASQELPVDQAPLQNQPIHKSIFNKKFTLIIAIGVILISVLGVLGSYMLIAKDKQYSSGINKDSTTPPITDTNQNTKMPDAKGEWKGVIWAGKGFIKIESNGKLENREFSAMLPKGMRSEYVSSNFTGKSNNGGDIFKNAFQLLNDGRIVFIGSPEISTAIKEDTLYSWRMGSLEDPRPEFTLPSGQKIERFAYSPDNNQLAVISVTLYPKEIYDLPDNSNLLTFGFAQAEIEKRTKKLLEELKIVTFFDVNTKKPIKVFNIEKKDQLSNRLAWRGNYLYVFDSFKFRVFDMNSFEVVYESDESDHGPIGDDITISPDGTKFINVYEQIIKVLPTKENLIQFSEPTVTGYNAFSFDSKKLLVQKTREGSGILSDVVAFGEVDLTAGKLKMIGTFESLIDGLTLDKSKGEWGYHIPMAVYNPAGDYVIFTVDTQGSNYVYSTDIYGLNLEEARVEGNNLKILLVTDREIAFIGWYRE